MTRTEIAVALERAHAALDVADEQAGREYESSPSESLVNVARELLDIVEALSKEVDAVNRAGESDQGGREL